MNFFMVCKVGFDPLFLTHHGVIHPAAVVIGAEHDAFGFVNAVEGYHNWRLLVFDQEIPP